MHGGLKVRKKMKAKLLLYSNVSARFSSRVHLKIYRRRLLWSYAYRH
jgi:hypothetical protein